MSYDVYLSKTFQQCIKILKKKYRGIKNDLHDAIKHLEEDPSIGEALPAWKKEIWKIRVASSDIKKGKRNGFRLIYLWKAGNCRVYLLAV
jgi:mRNA-degrading endonuclease RelE of RelBE toxin-antitoxin system